MNYENENQAMPEEELLENKKSKKDKKDKNDKQKAKREKKTDAKYL